MRRPVSWTVHLDSDSISRAVSLWLGTRALTLALTHSLAGVALHTHDLRSFLGILLVRAARTVQSPPTRQGASRWVRCALGSRSLGSWGRCLSRPRSTHSLSRSHIPGPRGESRVYVYVYTRTDPSHRSSILSPALNLSILSRSSQGFAGESTAVITPTLRQQRRRHDNTLIDCVYVYSASNRESLTWTTIGALVPRIWWMLGVLWAGIGARNELELWAV